MLSLKFLILKRKAYFVHHHGRHYVFSQSLYSWNTLFVDSNSMPTTSSIKGTF
jgi:hypothetical protein